jgi:hypothetical protein
LTYNLEDRERVFEFDVLELVDDFESLPQRKEYWITYYRSNELPYGYNLEVYKRPWEKEREQWRKEKSWGVDGDIQSFLYGIVKQLDYNLEYAKDRLNHVNKLLDDEKMKWLINYTSSPLFCKKQVKNKNDFLTENDLSLIGLSYIVDYLTFPKYYDQKEKELNISDQHTIRKKKSSANMDYRRGNEKLFGDKKEIEVDLMASRTKGKTKQNNLKEEDLKKYPEIAEVVEKIQYLKDTLGVNLDSTSKEEKQIQIANKYDSKQLSLMKKMLRDLNTESILMKDLLSGTIRFKKIMKDSTVFNYDSDTGYFDEHGDYVEVSENKLDLSKEKHVLELLNHYALLKQAYYDKPNSDMWAILTDLENLIDKTEFEKYIKDILIMKIDGCPASEIVEYISREYEIDLTEKRVSEIYNNIIPKMIVDTYIQEREDWIFTFKVKGTYKTCSKCKQVKLASERYFSLDRSRKDGFFPYCKKCNK